MKKNILLVHTGGTISMRLDDKTGAVLPNAQNPIMQVKEQLTQYANIIEIEAFNLPSPHITPHDMLYLRNLIIEQIDQQPFDGVVITHGTDTLEETAYFLDLTTQFHFPIILTGAMRSSNELGADGVYNLISAIRVAIDDNARDKGVLVVMNDEVHASADVVKTSTSNVSTFQSPQYGPIGLITKKLVHFHRTPLHKHYVEVTSLTKRVALLKAYAGMESDLLDNVITSGYDGLVLEGLGQGNVPPAVGQKVMDFVQNGFPVVFVSRCFNGIAEGVYGYDGGGKKLGDAGVIFATGLSGQKARLKLLMALNQDDSTMDIEAFF